ncbi:MAG: nickel ABC transporter ATP-binding protein NikE [Pikeienuella sp.]
MNQPAATPDESPVLEIEGYSLDYLTRRGPMRALDGIDLAVGRREILGLVGESGSGKTSLAWSIMRYLPGNAREAQGAIRLRGEDLTGKSQAEMGAIRGRRISMVFQDPSTSLNPTLSLGRQLSEVLTRHRALSERDAWEESVALLDRVGLKTPAQMMRRMPHEVSGGEKQRVVIAAAFACAPELIIFDEPTTALDVITARQVLDLLVDLQRETGVAALYISHDLSLVSRTAGRVAVLNKGVIVEQGRVGAVFGAPKDPYTRRLLAAAPHPDHRLTEDAPEAGPPLLSVEKVNVRYGRRTLLDFLMRREAAQVMGNRDLSLEVAPGEIFGVVGESGSGKSTLAKALTGLLPFEGGIRFDGRPIRGAADMDHAYRKDVQIVFQHPDASLNPRQRVREILSRPLKLYGGAGDRDARIGALLEQVRLPASYADRFPHELSGGEKQRVAIARAFASRPRMVICDEITSALDVSVQASIIELLLDLRRAHGTAYLFITHDLNLIRQIAHRVAVMFRGDLVEIQPAASIARAAGADYTRRLLAAAPAPVIAGAVTNP